MTKAASHADPAVPFDAAVLERRTHLRSDEAAFYLGYTQPKYSNPLKAFAELVRRNAVPKLYFGRRLVFRRRDLDAFLNGRRPGASS